MNILIFDIETTGFLNSGGTIVEIGIVELNLETGDRRILYNKVVRETGLTRAQVARSWIVTSGYMTTQEIMAGIPLAGELKEIQAIIDAYPNGATAFNRPFDFDFLESRGLSLPTKLACPMRLSTNICKLPKRNGGYKWPKVEEAWEFFFGRSTGYIELHRGADDAMHEALIVLELYRRGVFTLDAQ